MHAGVDPVNEGMSALLLGVIQGEPLLRVRAHSPCQQKVTARA